MHETPASLEAQFREQLELRQSILRLPLLRVWPVCGSEARNPKQLRSFILFTFDDGRESNYSVAAPLLESFGGRGVFFVVPAFAASASTEHALTFYRTRMNPDSTPGDENFEIGSR